MGGDEIFVRVYAIFKWKKKKEIIMVWNKREFI